jgi:hypothetical protein
VIKIKGLNPLYRDFPEVFWLLFEAPETGPDAPSVELLIRKFPEMDKAEAERLFGQWQFKKENPKTKTKDKK